MSIRDQSIRTLKLRMWQLSREWQEVAKEIVERAEVGEATDERLARLEHLTKSSLSLFNQLQPGDVITLEWAEQRDNLLHQMQQALNLPHQ